MHSQERGPLPRASLKEGSEWGLGGREAREDSTVGGHTGDGDSVS